MRDYKLKLTVINECRRYIENHLREDLDLASLARICNSSYSPFVRVFKEMTGYTPYQYIRLRRVQLAAQSLREGHTVGEAAEIAGFDTRAGLFKAFRSVYKVCPNVFAKSRGMDLMTPPKERRIESFILVGYVLEPDPTFTLKDMGAYWMIRAFPDVSAEEYHKIGGEDSAAAWIRIEDAERYLFGPFVQEVRYVPEHMRAHPIPGGLFLEFPVPEPDNSLILYENILVTWYYARKQWLPTSDYEEDTSRIAFEYYSGEKNSVMIPIKAREKNKN